MPVHRLYRARSMFHRCHNGRRRSRMRISIDSTTCPDPSFGMVLAFAVPGGRMRVRASSPGTRFQQAAGRARMRMTLLASEIALAFASGSAFANPVNNNTSDNNGDVNQAASATATQGGDGAPQANEFSTATLS